MINDGIQQTNGLPFLEPTPTFHFSCKMYFALHCPLNQRSTIKQWQGNAAINRAYAGTYRVERYTAPENEYVPLPFFPKEILDCKYSDHNPYLKQVLAAQIPLV